MKNSVIKIVLYLVIGISVTNCKVSKYINEKFPPFTTIDQRVNAIDQNLKFIDSIKPSIGIYVDSELLSEYVSNEIKKQLLDTADAEVHIEEVEPTISFEKQGVVINSTFLISIPEHNVTLKGKMIGVTAIATVKDSLYLRSAFESLKIDKVAFTKKPGLKKRAIAKLIVVVLKNYINNLNGAFLKDPIAMDIAWNDIVTFDPKDLFKSEGTEVTGGVTEVSRYLNQSAILVDEKGISILVELTDEDIIYNEDAHDTTNSHTRSELNNKFKIYQERYHAQWNKLFEMPSDSTSIAVMVSKEEIANLLNEGFVNGFSLKQKIDLPKISFDSKMEVEESNINCEKVRTDFSYPDFNGDSCNWSCMINTPFGRVEDPVCATTRSACRVRREAQRIAWQAVRETARIAHQAENELKVAGCKVWRETNNMLNLGRFKGGISGDGSGTMNFSKFQFSNDLSELLFSTEGNIDLTINTALRLRPQDLGHVFMCHVNYDREVRSSATAEIPTQQGKVSILPVQDGENLKLTASFKHLAYEAELFPSPLHVYLIDPSMSLQCPVFYSILAIGSGVGVGAFLAGVDLGIEAELLLLGKTKNHHQIKNSELIFKPMTIDIDENIQLKTKITWKKNCIDFSSVVN